MAPMIGWGQRSIAWRKSTRFRLSRKRTGTCGSTNSRMSAPAEKARSPAPVTTTTRAASLVARSPKQRVSSWRICSFIALWTSGRLRVIVTTPSAASWRIVAYFIGAGLQALGAGLLAEPRLENRQEILIVLQTQHPGAEARIVGEVLETERLAELDPEGLVADRQEEPLAIARLVETVGRVVADQHGLAGVVHGDARLERQDAAEQ